MSRPGTRLSSQRRHLRKAMPFFKAQSTPTTIWLLQTGVSAVGNTISESASVPAIAAPPVEQPSLAHADSSALTQPPEQAAPEHQDLTTPIHSLSVHIH